MGLDLTNIDGNSGLTRVTVAAIKRSIKRGLLMQVDHPEDAEAYLGYDKPTIVDKERRDLEYGCSRNSAIHALGRSLRGLDKPFLGIKPFPGLITDKRLLRRLAKKYRENGAGKGGLITWKRGVGVHGRTPQERLDDAREYGAALMIENGRVPISDREREVTYALYISPEGPKHQTGPHAGNPDQRAIAQFANDNYHGGNVVRSNKDVICIVRLEKERLARRAAAARLD